MDEIVVDGRRFISSKRAAALTGYAQDYVGQLSRMGKIAARRLGRAWYVDMEAIQAYHDAESLVEIQVQKGSEDIKPNLSTLNNTENITESKVESGISGISPISDTWFKGEKTLENKNPDHNRIQSFFPDERERGSKESENDLKASSPEKETKAAIVLDFHASRRYTRAETDLISDISESFNLKKKVIIVFCLFVASFITGALVERRDIASNSQVQSSFRLHLETAEIKEFFAELKG